MDSTENLQLVKAELTGINLELAATCQSFEELITALAAHLNYLIVHNFSLLISILYRVDIPEKKLKTLLQQNSQQTAGEVIATMIVNRQLEKIKARQSYKPLIDIPEDLQW